PAAPLVLAPNNARDGVGFAASAGAPTCVTPGLDPGVHLLGKNFFRSGWIAGSSPAMTIRYFAAGVFFLLRGTAALPPPQHEGEERAGRRECRDGVHDRASGMSHKATVVAIPCFCPVPPCYRRPNRATHATPPVRISRLHTAAYEQRRGARLWPAACF